MKKQILMFILTFIHTTGFGQNIYCDGVPFSNRPDFKGRENKMNQLIYNYLTSQPQHQRTGNVPLIIPVVFHVIHQNGPENVHDSVLIKEIDALNAYFSNSGPFYDSTGTNVNIQFCLASVDPWGNPTNGITRNVSVYADVNWTFGFNLTDDSMKNVSRWNPYRYMNIWIIRSVTGYANAYASYPSHLGQAVDGIVLSASALGGIHYIIAHEVGHYLGLYHGDHGNSCINFNCLLNGDFVCDTPRMLSGNFDCSISTCNTELDDTTGFNPFTSDQPDLSTIMSPKANCSLIFTQGQADRMNAALTQIRTGLLASNGCGANPGGVIPVAGITYNARCNPVSFISTSTNAEYIEWDFDNDGYFEAIGDTVQFLYSVTGNYTVKMRAFGPGGADEDTVSIHVIARPSPIYPLQSVTGVIQDKACYGKQVTFTAVPGMSSYLWSTGNTGQSISFIADSSFQISLRCTDTTGYVWELCPDTIMSFNVIRTPKPAIYSLSPDSLCSSDTLRLGVNLQPYNYVNRWHVNNFSIHIQDTLYNFYPLPPDNYLVYVTAGSWGCFESSDTLHFYSDSSIVLPFTPAASGDTIFGYPNPWNNQFYRDGVLIPGATQDSYTVTQPGCYSVSTWSLLPQCAVMSDTICFLIVGLDEQLINNESKIFPNPVIDRFSIRVPETASAKSFDKIIMRDIFGKEIELQFISTEPANIQADVSNLPNGIYILSLPGQTHRIIKMGK
ncbi:MAG: hypothetical protein DWQ33_03185 [Bacteroidetes bacterium]|nr:MAG: hypothetical protein DWQ33_03185 [Bacteroidota bacterium]